MGGSTSRFDETDWDKADGKVTTKHETTDDAAPTNSYGVYYLTKLGVGQRDYNVTDSQSNLLYRTRAVEGTLAWFDVLGRDDNDYRLRVQVDLSRRFWVVYRYGVPAFDGQMWDASATEGQGDHDGWRKPLFRRVCVTVTWSRYHAVVDRYRPAPKHEDNYECNDENHNKNISTERNESQKITAKDVRLCARRPSVVAASRTDSKHRQLGSNSFVDLGELCCSVTVVSDGGPDDDESIRTNETKNDLSDESSSEHEKDVIKSQSTNSLIAREATNAPLHDSSRSFDGAEEVGSSLVAMKNGRSRVEQQSSLGASITWVKSMASMASATVEPSAAPYAPENREEGVIILGQPVLKVQEINSIMGQHQTMIVREEEARQLKREELLTEAKLCKEAQASSSIGEGVHGESNADPVDYLWAYHISSEENASGSEAVGREGDANEVDDDVTSETADAPSDNLNENAERPCSDDQIEDQPLVGYWSWENSIRVHRMKMHVAKNSDLALHVVLAVVTNQLRNERHAAIAVAM